MFDNKVQESDESNNPLAVNRACLAFLCPNSGDTDAECTTADTNGKYQPKPFKTEILD